MTWTEIKKWAKEIGYSAIKNKNDGNYYWEKLDSQPLRSGIATSIRKLAIAIFNDRTNNKWIEHQINYVKNNTTAIQ